MPPRLDPLLVTQAHVWRPVTWAEGHGGFTDPVQTAVQRFQNMARTDTSVTVEEGPFNFGAPGIVRQTDRLDLEKGGDEHCLLASVKIVADVAFGDLKRNRHSRNLLLMTRSTMLTGEDIQCLILTPVEALLSPMVEDPQGILWSNILGMYVKVPMPRGRSVD